MLPISNPLKVSYGVKSTSRLAIPLQDAITKISMPEALKGYDTERLYAYLAERYLSFWFNKYTKVLNWPWVLFDPYKN